MKDDKKLNIRASGTIAMAVMLSRVLGLGREVIFNTLFGTASMGIFLMAFRAPNLLRDLFAEGALSVSFVTVFSKKMETSGTDAAWQLASKILTLTTVFMSVITILGIVFSEQLIEILAPGFSAEDAKSTIFMTQLIYPFILLVSLAAIVMGMLNARNVFGKPALASSFFNIGSIIGGVGFAWWLDPQFGERGLIGLAIGTLIGGFLQLVIQLPSLWKLGFRFKLDFHWKDPDVRHILILTVPAIIAASAVQINVIINSGFASYLGKEAVTWLNSAFRLMQFPLGVFGVAVATITLPVISRIAATRTDPTFGPTLAKAMRFSMFLTIPATVGLFCLAEPIIRLIYQHGKFHAVDTLETARTLQFYVLGLSAYSCIKILSPAFYAIDKKWVPMLVSLFSIIVNIVFNYLLIFQLSMGAGGLALSTSLSVVINFGILYFLMQQLYPLDNRDFLLTILRCTLASAGLGFTCWLMMNLGYAYLYHHSLFLTLSALLLTILFSGLVYLGVCLLLKEESVQQLAGALKKRVKVVEA